MSFDLPPPRQDTAFTLRDLEANAPKPTPKEIKAALIKAAQELEAWQALGADIARQLEEISRTRVSAMASDSAVNDQQARFRGQLEECARRLREMP